jgi:hypothetical protein
MEALIDGGFCNTRLTAKTGRPEVAESGVDTWRLLRRFDDDRDLQRVEKLARAREVRDAIDGHRWGLVPGRGLLWIEGHPSVDGLASPGLLSSCLERSLEQLGDAGVPLGRDAGIGRLDLTATLRFADRRQGAAFLAAVAKVDVPRCKPAIYGSPPETVYLLAERSGAKLARIYCKGTESRTAPYGELVRLEDQRRFKGGSRLSTEAVVQNGEVLSNALFNRRFAPVALASEGVTIATADVLADRLAELVLEGRCSAAKGCRLLGFLVHGDRGMVPDRTARRWRAELRQLGLILADPMEDPLEVDVAAGVEAALEVWSRDAAPA